MKKFTLLMVCLVALSTTVSAQGFGWGVKAGVNLAGVTNSTNGAFSKVGFTGGVFGDYRFSHSFAVSVELLYSAQGAHYDADNKSSLHYLNLPVMASFNIWGNLAVKAGIQPGLMLGATQFFEGQKISAANIYEALDWTVPVGLSYDFPLGIILEARYGVGLTNINEFKKLGSIRNGLFTLSAGFRF